MYNLFKRLMTTTTQQDIKKFDKIINRYMVSINDDKIHEKFLKNLNEKRCKCDEVKKIVKPKVTFRIEQD